MAGIHQADRQIRITTALGPDQLLLRSMSGVERLSSLFEYSLVLVSENPEINLDDLLGTDMTIEIDTARESTRYFHGYVSSCSRGTSSDQLSHYEVTLRPWLWFLTRTSDCRIFQGMTVPQIIQEVFGDEGFSDFTPRLTGSYDTWDYCVQYRETDFNFLSRLMEQEGIYYYFTHEEGKHTLVLADAGSAHEVDPSYDLVQFWPLDDQSREEDSLNTWNLKKTLQPGKFVVRDFNFLDPKSNMQVDHEYAGSYARADYEIYDYPGEYPLRATGERAVRYRAEEAEAQVGVYEGAGDVQGLSVGNLFSLDNAELPGDSVEYLITEATYWMSLDDYGSGGSGELEFQCSVRAILGQQQFRAPRVTPKPLIQGPQTAMVVGPAGEEIHTDEHGRVKLQFHWDRYGGSDENSSCWVRVSQAWAGAGWGAVHIPRIGQEVIVECLEGDPDRPIVTGRVYNGDNAYPYPLPADKTRSGIKSRSTKGAGAANFNEIRMEDKKGSEELYVHAEKDQNNVVENDETTSVGQDRAEMVGRDQSEEIGRDVTEKIGNNKTMEVGANHTETIGASMSLTVGSTKTELVKINSSETVGGARELTVGAGYTIVVGGSMSMQTGSAMTSSIGGSETITVSKNIVRKAGDNITETAGKALSLEIGKDHSVKIGGKSTTNIEKECVINAKKIQLVAKDEISLKAGKAEIIMKKNGDITIKGKKINVKGSGDVILKGSKIKGN